MCSPFKIFQKHLDNIYAAFGSNNYTSSDDMPPGYEPLSQMQSCMIIKHNHIDIENSSDSSASKLLQHYFEVTNNAGKYEIYDDSIKCLVKNMKYLDKTADETICYNILMWIDDNADDNADDITIDDIRHHTCSWKDAINNNNSQNIDKYESIFQDAKERKLSDIILLGELWLSYIGKIW